MRIDGIQLYEGSKVSNLTVASGDTFPTNPNEAEVFYLTSADISVEGLHVYIGGSWDRIGTTAGLTIPSGSSFPAAANQGDLFFNSDPFTGLCVYDGTKWVRAGTYTTIVVDAPFSRVVDGSTTILTFDDPFTANSSRVWVGGLRQKRGVDYVETSTTQITINYPISSTDIDNGMNIVVDFVAE